jgi:hypothetical protein
MSTKEKERLHAAVTTMNASMLWQVQENTM